MAQQIDSGLLDLDETLTTIAAKWCLGSLQKAEEYLDSDGHYVHCHASLVDAESYREEWCERGTILAIDADNLEIEIGTEYPHPVVRDAIPAGLISKIG